MPTKSKMGNMGRRHDEIVEEESQLQTSISDSEENDRGTTMKNRPLIQVSRIGGRDTAASKMASKMGMGTRMTRMKT